MRKTEGQNCLVENDYCTFSIYASWAIICWNETSDLFAIKAEELV